MTGRRSIYEYFGDVTDYENEDYETDENDYPSWPLLRAKGENCMRFVFLFFFFRFPKNCTGKG